MPSGLKPHLHVVLNDPFGKLREVLIVPICSAHEGSYDSSCILGVGDHKFLTHKSFISYHHLSIVGAEKLEKGVKLGEFKQFDPIDTAIFARICYGLSKSNSVAPLHLNFYRDATAQPSLPPPP